MEKLSIHKQLLVSKNPSWTKELHCRYFTTATLLWSSINPYKPTSYEVGFHRCRLLVVSDHRHGVHLREGKDHGGIHLARGRKTNHRVEISSRIGNKNLLFILPTNRNPFISSQNTVQKGIINKNFSFLWHIFVTSGNSTLQSCLTFPTQKISPEGTPLSTQVANAQLYAQEIGHQALQGGKQKSDQTLKKICPVKMLTLEVGLPPW